MNRTTLKKLRLVVFFVAFLGSRGLMKGFQSNAEDDMVSYQVAADKTEYDMGESAILTFTVTNKGNKPIYIHRDLRTCGKWPGHSEISIFDHQNRRVHRAGCEAYVTTFPGGQKTLINLRNWIRLLPHEVYGSEEAIDLPAQRGLYRLDAQLWPPGFSADEKKQLAAEKIRILQAKHSAPPLTIRIK